MVSFNFSYIQNYINVNKLNVKQFCEKAKITKQDYYKIKNNNLKIKINRVVNICRLLNITCEDFICCK